MKNGKLIVSPSPHIHGPFSTKRLTSDVLIALIPAFIVSVIVYGVNALINTLPRIQQVITSPAPTVNA